MSRPLWPASSLSLLYIRGPGTPWRHNNCSKPCAASLSIVCSSGHIYVVLRRSPARITSLSPSPRRRADETLSRPQLDQEFEGRVQNSKVSYVRSLVGWIEKTFDYINRIKLTLPLSVYEGTWTYSPPLIAMHLLDRSCVSVGFFFGNCMLRSPTVASERGLCVDDMHELL